MDAGPVVCVDCTGPVTVAALRHLDGVVAPLLFDGEPHLPSGVFATVDGDLLVGRDAVRAAGVDPERYVPAPARLLTPSGTRTQQGVDPAELVAACLRTVRAAASREAVGPVDSVLLVVPSTWGPQRRARLRTAAQRAGFTEVEFIDAALAALVGELGTRGRARGDSSTVIVYRLLGDWREATVLRRSGEAWEPLAAMDEDGSADGRDPADVVLRAATGADVDPAALGEIVAQAPPEMIGTLTRTLRDRGTAAPVRAVSNLDVVVAALRSRPAEPAREPIPVIRHVIATVVPLVGSAPLLLFLLRTGVERPRSGSLLLAAPRPPYMYTMWPSWGMVAILILLGTVGFALLAADLRQHSPGYTEGERRVLLVRGLRRAAAIGVLAGPVVGLMGGRWYVDVPMPYFLAWTTLPVLTVAVVIHAITAKIQRGDTTTVQWQIWLRFPNTAAVLMTAGLLAIELYLYRNTSEYAVLLDPGMPARVAELGTVAVALAVAALLLPRWTYLAMASPFVIGLVVAAYTYTNMMIVIGLLLAAIVVWWSTRISPAAAFADPNTTSILTAKHESTDRAGA